MRFADRIPIIEPSARITVEVAYVVYHVSCPLHDVGTSHPDGRKHSIPKKNVAKRALLAGFFREMGGLLYDGVVFTLAGFKVPRASSEGLLTASAEQTQPGLPQPTGVTNDGKTSTSVNPAEFAALVESGEIASISKNARLADERCTCLLNKRSFY